MHMINFLYNVVGKTELRITQEALSNMSLPDLFTLMKAEQDGKIKVTVEGEKQ